MVAGLSRIAPRGGQSEGAILISTVTSTISPASGALRDVAATDPNRVALEIDDRRVTYQQLNEQADRLAQALVTRLGDQPAQVALRALGTHEMLVGFLAIQRAGKVAVPVDPTIPLARIALILSDVNAPLLLSDVDGDAALGLDVPVEHPLTLGHDAAATPIDRKRGDLVSIVYTSGSTGAPKGIMMGREQMSTVFSRVLDFPIQAGGRLGAPTAGTVALAELMVGSALVLRGTLLPYEIRRQGLAPMGPWIASTEIEAFYTVPTVLRFLLPTLEPEQRFESLRTVIFGGEALTWDDVQRTRPRMHPEGVIINTFGQTETSGSASLTIPAEMPLGEGTVPGGLPAPETEVVIRDPDGRELPRGTPGEIVVRSHTVSLGYWRRPDLTKSTFIELPDGRREVRTGDRGLIREDGILEPLGRLDHLVKIFGNRVELGEVEVALNQINGVTAAACGTYVDEENNLRLVACVVPGEAAALDPRSVRASLTRRLPGYMTPSRIAIAAELPRLPGGKVDRLAIAELPIHAAGASESADGPPNQLERDLTAIWCEILERDHVGRQDDFFLIGGDSLRAAELFVELEDRLGIDRPVSLLAEAPTIASLALRLRDDDALWEAPLALRTEGSRPPLFVVHDGIGSVLYARGLVTELGHDQPIYGLRCAALNGMPPRENSLEEVAASHVQTVRSLYPDGPYLLYGVSLGGVIALEMARQLSEAGEDVPLVILGDSLAPGQAENPESRRERRAGQRLALSRLSAAGQLAYLARLARRNLRWRLGLDMRALRRAAPAGMGETSLDAGPVAPTDRAGLVLWSYGRLMSAYRPRPPFPERVVLLRVDGLGESPTRGWRPLIGASLQIIDVPGTHEDLGSESSGPHVGPVIARAIAGLTPAG